MARYVRLALAEQLGELANRELLLRRQREQAQPNGLGEELVQSTGCIYSRMRMDATESLLGRNGAPQRCDASVAFR
jgi:hypothetical protein